MSDKEKEDLLRDGDAPSGIDDKTEEARGAATDAENAEPKGSASDASDEKADKAKHAKKPSEDGGKRGSAGAGKQQRKGEPGKGAKPRNDATKPKKKENGRKKSGPFTFLKDCASELRRVTWPTRSETLKWSAVVIAALAFFGVFVMLLDNFVVTPLLYAVSGLQEYAGSLQGNEAISIALVATLVISGLGLIVFIMMHSGKGTGLSDSAVASLAPANQGLSVIERNLDRITIACAVIFLLSLVGLMIFFPQGTIATGA